MSVPEGTSKKEQQNRNHSGGANGAFITKHVYDELGTSCPPQRDDDGGALR